MFKIQTRNAIAESGTDLLKKAGCEVGPDTAAPDALLIRSAKLHDETFNEELLCIGRAGIGVDNIPLERCTEAGIAVFNTPGANADSVKELLICALILASRDVIGSIEWVRTLAGEGDRVSSLVEKGKNAFVGPEISGKRLGIIGLGGIGSKVANAALQMDMEVSGYDPYLSVDSAWNLSSKVDHYLNADAFSKMKPGMRLLNFARGELVDDDALLAALESGRVARYVTDFPNAKLIGAKNVVAMPHIGACTPEAEEKCGLMAAREIRDYLEDGNITNSVNLPAAYLDRLGESRLCLLHENKPGMLNAFLEIIAQDGINVEHMLNKARGSLAYTIFDTSPALDAAAADKMRAIPGVRRVRLLS